MKDYLGKEVVIMPDGGEPIKGILIQDMKYRVLIKGGNGKIFRIFKNKIVGFSPAKEEDETYEDIDILACRNKEIGCKGVQYLTSLNGKNPDNANYNSFMQDCPLKCKSCEKIYYGDMNNLPRKSLLDMLDKTIFGEYPNE
jgi:hypothetical protein